MHIVRYCSSSALKLACQKKKCFQPEPWNFFLKNKALTLRAFRGPGQAGFAHVRATKLTALVVTKCEQDSHPFCKSWMAKISQFLFPFSFMESWELDFDHHMIGPRVESQIYLWVGHHGKILSGFIHVVFLRLLFSGPRSALISKTPYITLILFYKIIKRGKFSPRQFTSMTDMAPPVITAASLTLLSLVIPWSHIRLDFMLNGLLFTTGLNLKKFMVEMPLDFKDFTIKVRIISWDWFLVDPYYKNIFPFTHLPLINMHLSAPCLVNPTRK